MGGPGEPRATNSQDADQERRMHGTAAAPGVAVGRVVRYRPVRVDGIPDPSKALAADEVEGEIARLRRAVEQVRQRVRAAREKAAASAGEDEAAIFDAHLLMLDDPALTAEQGEVERRVREQRQPVAPALRETAAALRTQLEQLSDDYLRARADDVEDIATQLLRALTGSLEEHDFPDNSIVVAEELFPSDTALFNPDQVVALVTERGSRTAHVAILARALEMPAIVGVEGALSAAQDGEGAIVDGDWGDLILSPSSATLPDYEERIDVERQERGRRLALHAVPAITQDQVRIAMYANIGQPGEADAALKHGAEGVGLFRTEFLFLNRPALPDEEEQYRAYRYVAEVMAHRPVVIRALDVGGDKPVPGIHLPPERNPFLGTRGLRLLLSHPEIMRTQLRAILRAATVGNLWIMFPMVATVDDLRDARAVVEDVRAELDEQRVAYRQDIPLGIMVETPAAALNAAALIRLVDFFSIGTNDLVQYTLVADRTNDRLARRYGPLDPSVLRLIGEVISAADADDKPVAVCGEMAGDPEAIPYLLGLGLRELSMTASSIGRAKEAVRGLRVADAEEQVQQRLTAGIND